MSFIDYYDQKRREGSCRYQAFTYAAARISVNGTINDLSELYGHHIDNLINDANKEMEELGNEENQIVKSQVS